MLCCGIDDARDIHTLTISTATRIAIDSYGLWGEINGRYLQIRHRLDRHMKPVFKLGEGVHRVPSQTSSGGDGLVAISFDRACEAFDKHPSCPRHLARR